MKGFETRVKGLIYTFVIAREWKECGEFEGAHKVIVVGNFVQAIIINLVLKERNMKVYYCTVENFERRYRRSKNIKWVIFDKRILHTQWTYTTDIIVMPNF